MSLRDGGRSGRVSMLRRPWVPASHAINDKAHTDHQGSRTPRAAEGPVLMTDRGWCRRLQVPLILVLLRSLFDVGRRFELVDVLLRDVVPIEAHFTREGPHEAP